MRSLADIQQAFVVSPETGLTADMVARSRQRFGSNRLTPLPREPLWKKFLEKFDEPIIKILLAAALLSMVVDLFTPPFEGMRFALGGGALGLAAAAVVAAYLAGRAQWVPTVLFVSALILFPIGLATHRASWDGLAVMVAVILATGVAFLSEYKSDREFELLNAHKEKIRIKVLRDSEFHTVGMEEVVVGDHVVLEMGDEIPADGRLIKATELYVDQSLMTGESEPARKGVRSADTADGPEQPGCLYRGTQVVDGVGQFVVTEVGDATYLGQIARRLSAEDEEDEEDETAAAETQEKRVKKKLTISKEMTPLQLKLTNLAELISKVGYIAAVAIFLALLVRGLIVGEVFWPRGDTFGEDALKVTGNLLQYFVYMVIIIVVAVPEGLPMSVTVSLALAMRKMTRANSLVRQLVACETIGSATVICSDKTGTLTQNRMTVSRVGLGGRVFEKEIDTPMLSPSPTGHWPRPGSPIDRLILNAAVNSTASLEDKDGKAAVVGNTTEGALLSWLRAGAWLRDDD